MSCTCAPEMTSTVFGLVGVIAVLSVIIFILVATLITVLYKYHNTHTALIVSHKNAYGPVLNVGKELFQTQDEPELLTFTNTEAIKMSENEAYEEVQPSTAASEATFTSSELATKPSENPAHKVQSSSESPAISIKLSENEAHKEVQSSSEALLSSCEYAYVKVDVAGGGGLQRGGNRTSGVEDNSHTSPDTSDLETSYVDVTIPDNIKKE